MMKLNYKGFTLIELLAVIAIMGMLAVIMVPTISGVIEENKNNSSNNLKNSIKSSARAYISDNRYEIRLDGSCTNSTEKKNITFIDNESITGSKITVKLLIEKGYLKSNSDDIINPETNRPIDANSSYIIVKYNCSSKDYEYGEPKIN